MKTHLATPPPSKRQPAQSSGGYLAFSHEQIP